MTQHQDNISPEIPAQPVPAQEAANVWGENVAPPQKALYPKPPKKWGMIEVLISLIALICIQIAIALVAVFMVASKIMASGTTDAQVGMSMAEEILYSPTMIITTSISMYLVWAGAMWFSTRWRGLKSWAKDFWVRFKLPRDILLGLGLAVLGFALVQGLSIGAEAVGINVSEASNTEIFDRQEGVWKYFFFIGMVSLLGPFMEELFFRGFVMQAFIRHFRRGNISAPRGPVSNWFFMNYTTVFNRYVDFRNWGYRHKYSISAVLSSIMFGFMHFQGTSPGQLLTVAVTGLLGLIFAIATIKTQRLGPAIFGHIFYNGTIAILTLFVF